MASALLLPATTHAIVGNGGTSADDIGRFVTTIVGSRGNFCSGTLIAPTLVLTAAHCVPPGAIYKILDYDADRRLRLRDIRDIAVHPGFDMRAMKAHRATADVALLRLDMSLQDGMAARLSVPTRPVIAGNRFRIAGIGFAIGGDSRSGGTVRAADLVATGKPGTLQIRLIDPLTQGRRIGLGACNGDSGGPVFEDQPTGRAIVGVVSWSTGPVGSAGCGGLTGTTPLTLYRAWILETARQWSLSL